MAKTKDGGADEDAMEEKRVSEMTKYMAMFVIGFASAALFVIVIIFILMLLDK